MSTLHRIIGLASAAALALTACGDDDSAAADTVDAYEVVTEATIEPGDPVPVPGGDVVLVLDGDISMTNVGDELHFDMATLESLGLVSYTLDDQAAEGRVVTFEGVLVETLLDVAGASDDASVLETAALNDYIVDIPVEDVESYPVLLATKVDGERMPIESYGPTRIVYPYHAFDLDDTTYAPRWIWQLASVTVR